MRAPSLPQHNRAISFLLGDGFRCYGMPPQRLTHALSGIAMDLWDQIQLAVALHGRGVVYHLSRRNESWVVILL